MPPIYVCFRNKLIELRIKKKKAIVATIFNIGSRSVEQENDVFYNLKENANILSARSVLEELTAKTIPCVLVQQASQSYLFALDSDLTKFIPIRKINGLVEGDGETLILNGPAFVNVTRQLVSFYHTDDTAMCNLKKHSYKLQAESDIACNCVKNDARSRSNQVNCFESASVLHVSSTNNRYLLFLKAGKVCNCSKTSYLLILEWCSETGFNLLPSKDFVPEEYYSNLTCLYHYQQKKSHQSIVRSVQHITFGTMDGFVIVVENGHLLNCISLWSETESLIPSPRPIDRICFSVNKMCGSNDRILVTQNERVFGLNTELQIVRSWTGIAKVFPCGYTDSGLLQFLLVRGDTLRDGWILTDLESQDITGEQSGYADEGNNEPESESCESLGSAVEALQKRLQGERLLIYEKEQQIRRCERFAREAVGRQFQLLEGREFTKKTDKANFVPLIEGPTIPSLTAGNQQINRGGDPDIEIVDIWQRTYSDKWLVAVSFKNTSSSDILVSTSLVPSHQHGYQDHLTCYSSQVVSKGCHKQSRNTQHHKTKSKHARIDISADRYNTYDLDQVESYREPDIAVCRTELPKFGVLDRYSVAVFVRLTINDTSKSENDLSLTKDRTENHNLGGGLGETKREESFLTNTGHVFSRHCGEVVLKVEDVISGKHEINVLTDSEPYDVEMQDLKDMKRDAAALEMIQQTTLLEIRATPSILTSLDHLLIDRCQFTHNQRLSCHVTRVQTLSRVQVQLGPYTGGDKRIVKVYSSCDKDLFLLVHHLYASLPDHVIILYQSPSRSDIIQSCLPSLQRELSFLEHGVRKLLDDTDHDQTGLTEAVGGNNEDIREVGEKFKRQKERLIEKMSREVNQDKLRDRYQQLMRLGMETDLNIVKALP